MAAKNDQHIGNLPRQHFHIMLNMADDDLNPYQYRLYGHYVRVAGETGGCWQGTRTTAAHCKMSIGKVVSTRRELATLGYITIEERPEDTLYVEIVDRWAENIARYAAPRSSGERPVHTVNTTVHVVNERRSTEEEPEKKIKKTSAAVAADPTNPVLEELVANQPADPQPQYAAEIKRSAKQAAHDALYEATATALKMQAAAGALISKYVNFLTGNVPEFAPAKGRKKPVANGDWHVYQVQPGMSADEIAAFGYFIELEEITPPTKPDSLNMWVARFRQDDQHDLYVHQHALARTAAAQMPQVDAETPSTENSDDTPITKEQRDQLETLIAEFGGKGRRNRS